MGEFPRTPLSHQTHNPNGQLKDQIEVLKKFAIAALEFLAPGISYCVALCYLPSDSWTPRLSGQAVLSFPFQWAHSKYLLLEHEACEMSYLPTSPNRVSWAATWDAQGIKKNKRRLGGSRERPERRLEIRKSFFFLLFSLINHITPAHSCCFWPVGLKHNWVISAAHDKGFLCGIWAFIFYFLGRRNKATWRDGKKKWGKS